ncbi:MAG: hypothetical protein NC390_02290 [Fusobacterium sp.]|nr:hypothetical protein [Fusobacterium sp.]
MKIVKQRDKKFINGNNGGHEHEWKFYAFTSNGKPRYKCKTCGKTCTEFSSDLAKKYYQHNLRLINSMFDKESGGYVWEEVLNRDENGDIIDSEAQAFYKIEKQILNWKQFQRFIRENRKDLQPLIVYAVKKDSVKSALCLFEVLFDE